MAQLKRESAAAKRGNTRLAKLKSIDPELDLGNGNSIAEYERKIGVVKKANDEYNTDKSKLDGQLDRLEGMETGLDEMSTNMLSGVRIRFGPDSAEYEMAGGTRKSEYKKRAQAEAGTSRRVRRAGGDCSRP